MTHVRPLLFFALAVCAWPAAAQPAGVTGRPIVCVDLPEGGTAPDDLGAALAAAERYELSADALSATLGRAARARDPQHIPVLKEIVEAYRCGVGNASLAMQAIAAAGEPADYFLAYVADAERDDALAAYAAGAVGSMLDPMLLPVLDSVIAALPRIGKDNEYGIPVRGPRGFDLITAGGNARRMLGRDNRYRRTLSNAQYIDRMARGAASFVTSAYFVGSRLVTSEADPWRSGNASTEAERRALWELARTHPTAVQRVAANNAAASISRFIALRGWTPDQAAQLIALSEQIALEVAFPPTAPPVPPVRTDVSLDLSGCRGELRTYPPRADGATESAAFVYSVESVAPFRVPYGPENRVSTDSGNEIAYASPEVFYADDDGPRPETRLFRVALPPGGAVTWNIGEQSITVDESTPLCAPDGRPDPGDDDSGGSPACDGVTATVYVADGTIVGGPDDGQFYAGTLRGSNQSDVIVGTAGADAIDAGNGTDTVCGGAGDDVLSGGNGRDALFGGAGDDALFGGNGRDALRGEAGTDSADGGRGRDACDAETETTCETDPQ